MEFGDSNHSRRYRRGKMLSSLSRESPNPGIFEQEFIKALSIYHRHKKIKTTFNARLKIWNLRIAQSSTKSSISRTWNPRILTSHLHRSSTYKYRTSRFVSL